MSLQPPSRSLGHLDILTPLLYLILTFTVPESQISLFFHHFDIQLTWHHIGKLHIMLLTPLYDPPLSASSAWRIAILHVAQSTIVSCIGQVIHHVIKPLVRFWVNLRCPSHAMTIWRIWHSDTAFSSVFPTFFHANEISLGRHVLEVPLDMHAHTWLHFSTGM